MKTKIYFTFIAVCTLAIASMVGMKETYAHRYHDHDQQKEAPTMHTDVPFRPVTMDELERFHGHVGPFVAMGARMGEFAVTQYNMPRYFGVTVDVECPAIPPHTCLIDGLMVASGATYGKKNINHIVAKEICVIISDDVTGAAVTFTLKSSTIDLLKKWEEEDMPIPERGQKCFDMKAEDLFEIQYKDKKSE